jgi:hypothetical protein
MYHHGVTVVTLVTDKLRLPNAYLKKKKEKTFVFLYSFYEMTTISREQALCICFLYEYNQKNLEKAENELKDMGDKFDVCYTTDPAVPVLVVKQRIYAAPFVFKRYVSVNTNKADAGPSHNQTLLGKK